MPKEFFKTQRVFYVYLSSIYNTLPYILIMRHDTTTWHVYRALERDIVQSILHTDTRPDEFFLWQNVEIVRRLYALSLCELKGATHPLPRADLALSEHVDLERINLHRNGFRAIELNLKLRSPHCSSADLFMPRGCLTIKQPLGREVHDRHTPSDAASNHFFDHNTTCFEISSASAVVSASTAKHRIEGRAAEILRFLFPHAYLHETDTMQIASSTAKATLDTYVGTGQLGAFQGPQGYLALAIRAAETFMETYYEMARHKFQHAPYRSSAHAGDPTWVDALPEQSAAVMLRTPGVHEYIAIEAAHYALRFLPLRMITANEVAEVALPYALEWSLTLADITWYTTAWDDPIAPRLPQHLRSDLADQLQRRQVLSPEAHSTARTSWNLAGSKATSRHRRLTESCERSKRHTMRLTCRRPRTSSRARPTEKSAFIKRARSCCWDRTPGHHRRRRRHRRHPMTCDSAVPRQTTQRSNTATRLRSQKCGHR